MSGLKTSCCTGGRCDLEQPFKAAHIVWALCVSLLPGPGELAVRRKLDPDSEVLFLSEEKTCWFREHSERKQIQQRHRGQYGPLFKVEELLEETLLLLSWLVYKNRVFKTGFGVIGLGWC